jgi:hypothetical protein
MYLFSVRGHSNTTCGVFDEVSLKLFLLFETLLLMLLEGKLCVTKQDIASKDAFFLNTHSICTHQKFKNVTQGGGVKKLSRII